MRRRLFAALFCVVHLTAATAASLPDLGDPSVAPVSDATERVLGNKIMGDIRADPSYVNDVDITDYLNEMGQRLVSHSQTPGTSTRLFFVNDAEINAFALPGGHIGVNSGLFLATQSEAELASVLAHETAHVTQRHYARSTATGSGSAIAILAATALAMVAAAHSSSPDGAQAALASMQAGMIQTQINDTRAHEQEADRVGFDMLRNAGYDPRGMASFFERMEKLTRLDDPALLPPFLRDHPLTTDRIADAHNRSDHLPYRQYASSVDYLLVKAKAEAMLLEPNEAVRHFQEAVGARSYGFEPAQRYGLAYALVRAHRDDEALAEIGRGEALLRHPMFATLRAQALLDAGRRREAAAQCGLAVKQWPLTASVAHNCAVIDHDAGDDPAALSLVNGLIELHPHDDRLFEIKARIHAARNEVTPWHMAQAEADRLQGNYAAAVEQLNIALKANKDYYMSSIIVAKLRDMKAAAARVREIQKNLPQ